MRVWGRLYLWTGNVEFRKIKNKWRRALKIPWTEKTSQPVIQTAQFNYFAKPTWFGSFLVHDLGTIKLPRLIWVRQPWINFLSFKKIPIFSVFCKLGIYRKSVFQSLNFVFLSSHRWDFSFCILWFHLDWNSFTGGNIIFALPSDSTMESLGLSFSAL